MDEESRGWGIIKTTADEAAAFVECAVKAEPELTLHGTDIYDRKAVVRSGGSTAVQDKIKEGQIGLRGPDGLRQVAAAADWLRSKATTKHPDRNHSSYGYKHIVESWFRKRGQPEYVSNGAFIAAAIGLGVPAKRCSFGSPNMHFGISRRGLRSDTETAVSESESGCL